MQTRERLAQLLKGLSARIGLPGLALDLTGVCALAFDDAAVLHIAPEEAAGSVLLYARVGEVPHNRPPAVYRDLLVANARGEWTGTLAVDERDESVLLVHRVPVDGLDDAGFERLVEAVAASALQWSAVLSGGGDDAKPASDAGDDPSLLMRFAIRG